MRQGDVQHERALAEQISSLGLRGFAVLSLKGRCPDAIAFKDGRFYAVETLGLVKGGKRLKSDYVRMKRESYLDLGVQDVLFNFFEYDGTGQKRGPMTKYNQLLAEARSRRT